MNKKPRPFTMAHVWSSLDDDPKFKKHVRAEKQRPRPAQPTPKERRP